MATKLGRIVTYFERLLIIKSFCTLIAWSCKDHVTNKSHYISTTRVLMATNFAPLELHFENFIIFGGLYIIHSNIYDGAFIVYSFNSKPLTIFTKKLHCRYSLGFKLRLYFFKTLQTINFFKVFYVIRLLKSVNCLKYFTSFNSSNMLWTFNYKPFDLLNAIPLSRTKTFVSNLLMSSF